MNLQVNTLKDLIADLEQRFVQYLNFRSALTEYLNILLSAQDNSTMHSSVRERERLWLYLDYAFHPNDND